MIDISGHFLEILSIQKIGDKGISDELILEFGILAKSKFYTVFHGSIT